MRLVGALGVLSVQALLKGAERSLPWDQQRDAFRNSECPCGAPALVVPLPLWCPCLGCAAQADMAPTLLAGHRVRAWSSLVPADATILPLAPLLWVRAALMAAMLSVPWPLPTEHPPDCRYATLTQIRSAEVSWCVFLWGWLDVISAEIQLNRTLHSTGCVLSSRVATAMPAVLMPALVGPVPHTPMPRLRAPPTLHPARPCLQRGPGGCGGGDQP